MTKDNAEVVIVGGGIVGVSTAYFLGKAGVNSTIVERDSVGSHASGFAYGGLSALGGIGNPGPLSPVAAVISAAVWKTRSWSRAEIFSVVLGSIDISSSVPASAASYRPPAELAACVSLTW